MDDIENDMIVEVKKSDAVVMLEEQIESLHLSIDSKCDRICALESVVDEKNKEIVSLRNEIKSLNQVITQNRENAHSVINGLKINCKTKDDAFWTVKKELQQSLAIIAEHNLTIKEYKVSIFIWATRVKNLECRLNTLYKDGVTFNNGILKIVKRFRATSSLLAEYGAEYADALREEKLCQLQNINESKD